MRPVAPRTCSAVCGGARSGSSFRRERILALDDLSHRLPRHRLAHLGRLRVRARRAHPPAHVRVDREPLRAHEHLAGARRRYRALDEREVALLREALGPSRQRDLPVHHDRDLLTGSGEAATFRDLRASQICFRRFVTCANNGASRARTGDLLAASQTLSQLSYGPWVSEIVARPSRLRRRPRGRRPRGPRADRRRGSRE